MRRILIMSEQFSSTAGVQEAKMDGVESSINFKRKILQKVKDLTNHGKHKEASELFKIYFPNFGGNNGKD